MMFMQTLAAGMDGDSADATIDTAIAALQVRPAPAAVVRCEAEHVAVVQGIAAAVRPSLYKYQVVSTPEFTEAAVRGVDGFAARFADTASAAPPLSKARAAGDDDRSPVADVVFCQAGVSLGVPLDNRCAAPAVDAQYFVPFPIQVGRLPPYCAVGQLGLTAPCLQINYVAQATRIMLPLANPDMPRLKACSSPHVVTVPCAE
jgi:hypothetical protein